MKAWQLLSTETKISAKEKDCSMLTKYDEYPVHQAVRPFSEIPSTDYAWNDGYYFAVYNALLKIKIFWCLRVHPNSDVVHAWAGIVHNGKQRTVRFSRAWRPDCDTVIGAYSIDFIEAFKRIRLKLEPNDSNFFFDIEWRGIAPPHEEDRRLFVFNGRRVTDQLRYVQAGAAAGWLQIDGERIEIDESLGWGALRDHSWGLYFETAPIKPDRKWFPPQYRTRSFDNQAHIAPSRLAFYSWNTFRTEEFSGWFWTYEDENGLLQPVWGGTQSMQLGGVIDRGWEGPRIHVAAVEHQYRFKAGSRLLEGGIVTAVDADGGRWVQEFEPGGPPWIFYPCGPFQGAWRDGGNWATYHGEGVAMEWDEVDISNQPMDYQSAPDLPLIKNIQGAEYEFSLRLTDPAGKVHIGSAHVEHMSFGAYKPYGFTDEGYRAVDVGPFEL